jgi:hypothetical protein
MHSAHNFKVYLPRHVRLINGSKNVQTHFVHISMHPQFPIFSEKSGGIIFGQSVVPICLPSPKLNSRQFSNVTISGWGKVNYEGFSTSVERGLDTLQDAQVPIVESVVCATEKVNKIFFFSRKDLRDNENKTG